jgi:hypothetical protein
MKNTCMYLCVCIYIYIYIYITAKISILFAELCILVQKSIEGEIKSRLKSGNACYYSVQNLLSSRLLTKKFKD